MRQEVDVLDMVVCLIITLGLLLRLAGMNALQNAQTPAKWAHEKDTVLSVLPPL